MREKPPLSPSATLPASTEDDSFGSRKARSSFGKGFFKIRGGKKSGSTPNLGKIIAYNLATVFVHSDLAHVVYCVSREVSCGADSMFMTHWDFLEDLSFYPLFTFSSHTHGVHFMDRNLQPTQPVVPI